MAAESTERSRNRRGQGGLLRDEILAAADRVVAESANEESVSLRAIARETGIAAPSIYVHFANRQETLRELLERDYADLVDRLRTVRSPCGERSRCRRSPRPIPATASAS